METTGRQMFLEMANPTFKKIRVEKPKHSKLCMAVTVNGYTYWVDYKKQIYYYI